MTKVILASGSPSRLALLRTAGLDPVVQVSGVDERAMSAETPAQLAMRLADSKASAVAAELDDGLIIGCDSLLEIEGHAYGKPNTPQAAREQWRLISGGSAVFHTGHCVIDAASGTSASALGSTTVYFAELTPEEIAAYVATGEPLGVAGAFKVNGRGGWFVERIEGDHGNLQGLSLPLLRHLMRQLNIEIIDLWNLCKPHPALGSRRTFVPWSELKYRAVFESPSSPAVRR
jgi:septum formation protein